jgi:hypothetical protein
MADTILHEIMHMRQYRRRKFKILPDYASTAEKTEQRAEQDLWTDAAFDASLDLGPVSNLA